MLQEFPPRLHVLNWRQMKKMFFTISWYKKIKNIWKWSLGVCKTHKNNFLEIWCHMKAQSNFENKKSFKFWKKCSKNAIFWIYKMQNLADMADRVADNLRQGPLSPKEVPKKFSCSNKNLWPVKVQICETPPKNGHFWGGFVTYFVNLRHEVWAG